MRRIYFAFLCFFLALSPLFADNEVKVHLKENGNSKVTVSKGNIFDFTVEMSDQDENRTVAISISLQNYGSTESIFIFLDEYSGMSIYQIKQVFHSMDHLYIKHLNLIDQRLHQYSLVLFHKLLHHY